MKNKEFKELIRNHNGFLKNRGFDINEVIDFKDFDFSGIESIVFEGCEFKQGIIIRNINNFEVGLDFKNCKIENRKKIHVFDSKLRYITVVNCVVSDIDFRKLDVDFGIYISALQNNLLLRILKVKSPTLDVNCDISEMGSLILSNKEIDEIHIHAKFKIKELRINEIVKLDCSGQFEKVTINDGDFKFIEFSSIIEDQVEIITEIGEFGVYSAVLGGALILNGCNISKLFFESVSSQNGVFLCNNSEITMAAFYSTYLKSISWNNVDFKKTLNIDNSDFSGLKYANINWIPKTKFSCIELQYDVWFYRKSEKQLILSKIKDLVNDREVYRQLKAAANSNQNNIDALEFYRLEMRLYWKEVRLTKNIRRKDRWLIFVNWIISDFGQNWWLPLIWLFGVHYLLFMSIFEWHYYLNLEDFKNGLGAFFELLNPVHKTPEYINTGIGVFTEFWMRILAGFFIYHFIKVTRKYAKV